MYAHQANTRMIIVMIAPAREASPRRTNTKATPGRWHGEKADEGEVLRSRTIVDVERGPTASWWSPAVSIQSATASTDDSVCQLLRSIWPY
jgi:hypothetical protein